MPLPPADNLRSPAALARLFGVAAVSLVVDLWTKHLAADALNVAGETIRFIPGVLHFVYTENRGAVFGLGQGMRPLFLIVSVLAVGCLVWLFAGSGKLRFYQVILGMLMAGVVGNMYDRIVFGYVRDMIFALPGWNWPDWVVNLIPAAWRHGSRELAVFPWIFNVADSLLCVGVTFMIAHGLIATRQAHRAQSRPAEETAAVGRHAPPRP
jgi:signal peptidase II